MLSKAERKIKLMERAQALGLYSPAVFLLPSTRAEIKGEAKAIKDSVAASMNDEIQDEEKIGVVSRLSFDIAKLRTETDDDILLTRREKAQLAREVAPFKQFRSVVTASPLLLMG